MQPIQLSVFSEIARLKQVVVHDPGPEVDLMVPGMMEKLLFDDILFGDHARQEHALFRRVLARVADEVLDVQDLFVEALADEGVKLAFIEDLRRLAGLPDETCNLLRDMPSAQAARSVITGVPWDDMPSHTHWEQEFDYRLRPIPNLLFMRDPASVIGDGYSVNAMATWAREREPLILSYHLPAPPAPAAPHGPGQVVRPGEPPDPGRDQGPREPGGRRHPGGVRQGAGGGLFRAQHTDAITCLAESLRADHVAGEGRFEHLVMVLMPKKRSAMHLDTIFTRISEGECLVYPPYFTDGSRELLNVVVMDLRHQELRFTTQPNLLAALKGLGIDLAAHLLRRPGLHPPAAGAVDGRGQRLRPGPRA